MKKKTKYIHSGRYMAEVEIQLIEGDDEWAPYISVEDAARLDEVREALQREDLESASRNARIYKLEPVNQL